MRVHSLRPNTMRGRVYLYRSALYENTNYHAYVAPGDRGVLCLAHPRMSVIYANHWKNAYKPMGDLDRYGFPRFEHHHPLVSVGGNPNGAKLRRGPNRLLSPKSETPRLPAARFW